MQSFVPMPQSLKHASYVPGSPAAFTVEPNISLPAFGDMTVQIGDDPAVNFSALGETLGEFLATVAAAGIVSIATQGTFITFSAPRRLRVGGMIAMMFFYGEKDVSPVEPRVYDTDTAHVRHEDVPLSEHLAAVDARYHNPRSVVVGQRLHPPFASLVSLGATEGDTIEIYHGAGYDVFTIDGTVSALDFVGFISSSHGLNTAMGSHVDAYVDNNFQNVVVFSKRNEPVVIQATRTATFASVFGSYPA